MRRTVTLRPGARGTKRLQARFGNELMFVRYRYDAGVRRRYKTIELIVDERRWLPRHLRDILVGIRLAFNERDMRLHILRCGGQWDPAHQCWELRLEDADHLGLIDRIAYGRLPGA